MALVFDIEIVIHAPFFDLSLMQPVIVDNLFDVTQITIISQREVDIAIMADFQ